MYTCLRNTSQWMSNWHLKFILSTLKLMAITPNTAPAFSPTSVGIFFILHSSLCITSHFYPLGKHICFAFTLLPATGLPYCTLNTLVVLPTQGLCCCFLCLEGSSLRYLCAAPFISLSHCSDVTFSTSSFSTNLYKMVMPISPILSILYPYFSPKHLLISNLPYNSFLMFFIVSFHSKRM